MEKTKLEMDFLDALNKIARVSLDDPKTDLLPSEIQAAMENIIAQNVFTSKDGDYMSVAGARIITTNVSEMEF